ncbi:MAG: GTPase HflX, partial [Alphaproteobacteria bacterium]|nr:GTPase HflX [Alphaproteobacteria bacterium]
ATLEETVHADVILHVRDISAPYTDAERSDVLTTLERMELDKTTPVWEVWNKIDLLEGEQKETAIANAGKQTPLAIATSALTGEGMPELLQRIDALLADRDIVKILRLSTAEGEKLAWLYRHTQILDRKDQDSLITLTIQISPSKLGQFNHSFGTKAA